MREISRELLQEWMDAKREFVLIDVREPREHQSHNIGGQLIPLSEINKPLELLKTDLPVVVYCRKGIRSQIAIQRWQRKYPTTKFFNLKAGISNS